MPLEANGSDNDADKSELAAFFYQHIAMICLIFVCAGLILFIIFGSNQSYSYVTNPVAGVLISTGLVSLTFRFLLEDVSTMRIKKALLPLFQELKGCEDTLKESQATFNMNMRIREQIDFIFPRRTDKDALLVKNICGDIRNSENLYIMGVSLREFFHNNKPFCSYIEDCLESASPNQSIFSIIANPFNKQVIKRTLWEEGDEFENACIGQTGNPYKYIESATFKDIKTTLDNIYKLNNNNFEGQISLRVHDNGEPSMWLLITDDHAYYHPYAYGVERRPRGLGFCIGQWFCVTAFNKDTMYYDALRHHFLHQWRDPDNLQFEQIKTIVDGSDSVSLKKIFDTQFSSTN